jgi:outer membrane protein assembly factor BamB
MVVRPSGVVRLRHDGSVDHQWRLQVSPRISVDRFVRSGSRLYVEGRVHPAAARPDAYVEAFDARTGKRQWTSPPFASGPQGGDEVLALAVSRTRIYVGGGFVKVGGVPRRWLTALDARTGRTLDWHVPPLGAFSDIEALAVGGSRLYIGGVFARVGGHRRVNLAALDAGTGALLPWTNPTADPDETWNIFVVRGQVLTWGKVSFGAADARSGRPLLWPSRMSGDAAAFAADGPLVYLGGVFPFIIKSVDGHRRNNLAVYKLATGRFTNWAPILARYVEVGSIAPSGDAVLVTGVFSNSLG